MESRGVFERGEKLWLCLSFHDLPLNALSIKPLGASATGDAEGHTDWQRLESETNPGGSEGPGERCPSREIGELPVAVLEKQRVLVCNGAAAALGIKRGMGTATARALADSILLLERDPAAEQRHLQQLCCWGYSISPTLYPFRDDCLLLEVGSCLRLYGGIEALLTRVESDLSRRGAHYRMGLGPTPKSAVLLSINPLEASASDSSSEALNHRRASDSSLEALNHRRASDSSLEALNHRRASDSSLEAPDHRRASDSSSEALDDRRAYGSSSEASGDSLNSDSGEVGLGRSHDNSAESLEARLAPLPLKLLEDFPRQVDALARAGLWTFGDILTLPRQALARRCGREFVHHLEQILGTAEDRQPNFEPPRTFSDHYWFGYEVKANQELLPAIELLLKSFCHFLRNTQLETRQLEWLLYGINRKVHRFALCSSQPQTHWQAWYQLTRLKVEQLELDHSIEGVGLVSEQLVPGNASSGDLFQQAGQKEPLHSLLDRLKSRLGLQSVSKIACRDEHLPEFAGYCSLDTRPGTVPSENGELRPFWLIPEPQPLQVFNGQPCWQGRLELLDGPERIEDNWWQSPVSRDYYVARDSAGVLYWVFRDRLHNQWYMQGIFQ